MVKLPEGKVDHNILKQITEMTGYTVPGIIQKPLPGTDVGVLDLEAVIENINGFYETTGEPYLVYKSDPITFPTSRPGWYLITVNENDIATAGAKGFAMTVTMLIPPGMEDEEILRVQQELNEVALEREITILGGHSEVTSSVNRLILSGNMIGFVPPNFYIGRQVKEGNDIILSGWIGAEGTGILLDEGRDYFDNLLTKEEISQGTSIGKDLQIANRILNLIKHNRKGITMIHDITEGGILTALYEAVEPSEYGINVNQNKFCVAEVTKKICQIVNIDPLQLIGSGAVLIFCNPKYSEDILSDLSNTNFPASNIGTVTETKQFLLDNNQFNQTPDSIIDGLQQLYELMDM